MLIILILGRPWAIQELREKSWDDLHKLWWVCVKERNRISTSNYERERLKPGYGDHEAQARDRAVSQTPKSPVLGATFLFGSAYGNYPLPILQPTGCLSISRSFVENMY